MSQNHVVRQTVIQINKFSLLSFFAIYISYQFWYPQAESFHLDLISWLFFLIGLHGIVDTIKLIIKIYRYEMNHYKIVSKGKEIRPNNMINEQDLRKTGLFK